jgi:prevent-host-death family protein
MQKAPISILKARLSQYLSAVKSGEEVIVTEHGRPIARITAVEGDAAAGGRVSMLIREGRLRPPTARAPMSQVLPEDPAGRSLALLLEERAQGR